MVYLLLRLEIAVDDLALVHELDCVDDLSCIVPDRLNVERTMLADQVEQLSIAGKLEHVV